MTDEAAFLRAIQAAPADDAHWLVYADWLDERGDPRGQFLRDEVQVAERFRAGKPAGAKKLRGAVEEIGLEWALAAARPPVGVCSTLQFTGSGKPVTATELDTAAKNRGRSLPPDYRAFLLLHNGGRPNRHHFDYVGNPIEGPEVLTNLIPFRAAHAFQSVLESYEGQMADEDAEHLFDNLITIGWVAAAQDCLALSIAAEHFGSVFYQPYNEGLQVPNKVADSFAEFLAILKEPPPEWVSMVREGDSARLRKWLDAGGDAMTQEPESGYTPLELAIVHDRANVVAAILRRDPKLAKGYVTRLTGLVREYNRTNIGLLLEEHLKDR
jgi:uncharacterized protein (TIGR02996 family)